MFYHYAPFPVPKAYLEAGHILSCSVAYMLPSQMRRQGHFSIYKIFRNLLLIDYFIYPLIKWSDPGRFSCSCIFQCTNSFNLCTSWLIHWFYFGIFCFLFKVIFIKIFCNCRTVPVLGISF